MNTKPSWPVATLARMILSVCAMIVALPATAIGATPEAVQVASSAQLVLDVAARPGKLTLWITRAPDHTPVTGAGNVSVRLDGHVVRVSAQQTDYVVATDGLHGGRQPIEVIVAHDGIRELLSGTVTLPATPSTLETLQKHSGWAWWVLNIAVLLLAFRLISRKKKTS